MAVVKYHRYTGELWQDLDLENLVDALSDFFLQSGFGEDGEEWNEDALQQLHDAILDALMQRGLLPDEDLQKLLSDQRGARRVPRQGRRAAACARATCARARRSRSSTRPAQAGAAGPRARP